MKTVLKNVNTIVSNNKTKQEDIFIDKDVIVKPFELDSNTEVIDCHGQNAVPGLIDIHVHFRDPGLTHKEDILSGSRAAAAGGFTTVCAMANTKPTVDSVETLEYVDQKGKEAGLVNVLSVGAMSVGLKGHEVSDIKAMNDTDTLAKHLSGHGIIAASDDGVTLVDNDIMKEVCQLCSELDLLIMDHPEPETEMIARNIELAKQYNIRIHLQHISRKDSVELIRQAKKDGISITAEAAPHHFVLNDSIIETFGTNAKMNPPLAREKDREAVLDALIDDTIDLIATDHAPHTEAEKNVSFTDAPNGIIGLETAFPVSYTYLVRNGYISYEKLIYKMSAKPAEIIGIQRGTLDIGANADIAIIDIDEEYIIDKTKFNTKGRNTPFDGMKVYGKIVRTIKDGKTTWEKKR